MSDSFSQCELDNRTNCTKLVLLGEAGVGKTCIANSFISNEFKQTNPNVGTHFSQKIVYNKTTEKTIRFDIWDTAGQEKFRALNKIFYKDARAVLLVYDITNKSSFLEIKNYWLAQMKENLKEPSK